MTQSFLIPQLPFGQAGYGFRTPFGVLLPPGSQVAAYLRSTGPQSGDDPSISPNLVTTLASALLRCRSGLGDTILVLPGHSESVVDNTMLTNLVPGTRIIGIGQGANMPVFRWTQLAGQWILNDADVTLAGLRLRLEGNNGITVALDVSAADNVLTECDIETSSGAANLAAVALRLSAGATRFVASRNLFRGVAAGVSTDIVLINAAVDLPQLVDNVMLAPSTNGFFRTAAAATNMFIARNRVYNIAAGIAVGAVYGAQASDGILVDNYFAVKAAATGVTVITQGSGIAQNFQNGFTDGGTLFAAMTVGSAVAS